ncbi:hypothetical protein L596_001348 [Steinernema carpocapsae]|uniref:Uncharacterized protein n=2 Tax=Steinernema carpocapsae TaxID=34508 RepID=A0A4U8ULA3_STECR|nr:hypothetical protein L596_001348 [Steinernema carpocapsae]
MQHHMGGIPAHSQPPQHMQTYMQPEQMTMAPNDMNQQTYNVQTMPPRQRRTVVNPSMTLPPAAQVQQDNQNGQNMYTVNIPQHSYPSHQMMTQPPPHGTYQPYTPYQHQPMPPYQQPVFQPIPQTHRMQPVFQPPPQRTQPPQSHRPRKVLKITNPETNSVINDKEVAQAESASVPAPSTAAERTPPIADPLKAPEKFVFFISRFCT